MQKFFYFILLSVLMSCHTNTTPEKALRYLALGDSYTIGESVASGKNYPNQLADSLKAADIPMEDPEIIAVTGWTTGELKEGIAVKNPQGPYDLVSLLIGVNNQYRGMDVEIYRQEFKELLEQAIAFAGEQKDRVFVLSIPDWGVTPFAAGRDTAKIAEEIDMYNEIAEDITKDKDVRYFDVTAISRMATTDPLLITSDGLHPSAEMYSAWVGAIFSEITLMLKASNHE